MEVGRIDPGRLVFVDEMGTHTSLAPLYAYAPVGERAFFEIPRNRGARTQNAACEPSPRRDGAFYGRGRSDYRPRLRNLHGAGAGSRPAARSSCGDGQPRSSQTKESERVDRGARMRSHLPLPSYSPDLNPIEQALSKIKHILRKIGARTKELLIEAMGRALAAVSTEDVRGFFAHCGYRSPAQQL